MIQKGRFSLSKLEFKAVSYLISKVKPTDQPGQTYKFSCYEFQELMQWVPETSYTNTKGMLQRLATKGWWVTLPNGKQSFVHWLYVVRMDPRDSTIEIKFHEDMEPYIIDLKRQHDEGKYITSWSLASIGPMKSSYSPRIYELLKSYVNNDSWIFGFNTGDENDLCQILAKIEMDAKNPNKERVTMPSSWKYFSAFCRSVLEPAKEEINKFTDIQMDYEGLKINPSTGVRTSSFSAIKMYMRRKTNHEMEDVKEELGSSYNWETSTSENASVIEKQFIAQGKLQEEKEKIEKKIVEESEIENKAEETPFPIFYTSMAKEGFNDTEIENLYHACVKWIVPGQIKRSFYDPWAQEYADHYLDWIKMTPNDTKTTKYKRLLAALYNDYDCVRNKKTQWDA